MKRSKLLNLLLTFTAIFGLVVVASPSSPASASSHREAPLISQDPTADVTDLYAFRSPDISDTVTLIANWIPLEQPAGGPNFYKFDDSVLYAINIDNTGDGYEDIQFQFKFRTEIQNPNTFLYNTSTITSLNDPDYNIRQFYDVIRVTYHNDGHEDIEMNRRTIASHVPVPPVNIGPRSTPNSNYENLASAAIANLIGGGKVFAGQRDDPFFVDLGSVFDLAGLRPLNPYHRIPLPAAPGVDGVAGYNVHTTALQVPISSLGAQNGVIGVYAASYRSKTRVISNDGTIKNNGPLKQVSRIGNPLVNEVLIPLGKKDLWNATDPSDDYQFDTYVANPEPAALENYLYSPPITATELIYRDDLLDVFVRGFPTINQLPELTHSDMLRLNMNIPPTPPNQASRLGLLGGDFAGFPNGRRLADDVTDIELRALACGYGAVGVPVYQLTGNCDPAVFNGFPNNALTDGVDHNEKAFSAQFPYMATPFQGYEAIPPTPSIPLDKAALGFSGAAAGLGLLLVYRRRKARKVSS